MPITLKTAQHAARKWTADTVATSEALLEGSCPKEHRRLEKLIQSAFSQELSENTPITPSANGFVYSIWKAYSLHQHLTIRPEDVWFSILTQLNFYINANAEELRSFFVNHEGQKAVTIEAPGTIASADFGALAPAITGAMQKDVNDSDLREWILPSFSTTTENDKIVASILMMGALQSYFKYRINMVCGIPTVTLLGEREDWEKIYNKLDKIPQLGKEAATFTSLLKPVLRHFMLSFDKSESSEVLDFWGRCCHQTPGGSGPSFIGGWLTAFCFWDSEGKPFYKEGGPQGPVDFGPFTGGRAGCELDGVLFHKVDTKQIPSGFASVPVTVDDNGNIHETIMVAGSVGLHVTSSGKKLDIQQEEESEEQPATQQEETGLDSIQPLSGWWMYSKKDAEGAEQEERQAKRAKVEPESNAQKTEQEPKITSVPVAVPS